VKPEETMLGTYAYCREWGRSNKVYGRDTVAYVTEVVGVALPGNMGLIFSN
jgi:hypothetical protein